MYSHDMQTSVQMLNFTQNYWDWKIMQIHPLQILINGNNLNKNIFYTLIWGNTLFWTQIRHNLRVIAYLNFEDVLGLKEIRLANDGIPSESCQVG